MPNLDASEIEQLVRDVMDEPHFQERKTLWEYQRKLVFRESPVVIPGTEMETEYRTAELLDAADKYTARFLGSRFTVNISAQGPGPVAEKKAQAMENYNYRLLSRWWSSGLFTGAIHDMAGVTGEGWVHLTLNRQVLPVIPQKDDGEDDEAYLERAKPILDEFTSGEKPDLFVIEPVSEPETIYYNKDRSVIFSVSEVPLPPLQRQYARSGAGGEYGEAGKGKTITKENGLYEVRTIEGGVHPEGINQGIYNETVLLYIVETDEYIYHLVDNAGTGKERKLQPLGCYKNVFGAPGFVWVHARTTNHPSSKHSVHPLTHAAIALAPQVNIMGTIVYSGGIYGEFTRISLKPATGPEAALERANNKNLEIELLGNRVTKPPDGWEFDQPNIGVQADTLNAFASLEQKMLQAGYSPALEPNEAMQATSGYQQAVIRDMAASTLDPPLTNIASMLRRICDLIDVGVKTLGIPITFRNFAATAEVGAVARSVREEITIDPEDIVDVDRSISFDSLTQYARQAMIELGMTLLDAGRITEDMFFRDYMGVDDPLRLKKQRLIEKAQTLAEEFALITSKALFQEVVQPVGAEAVAETGLTGLAPGAPMPPPHPGGGVYTGNGAGGAVPLQPEPPNPQAEMSMTGSMG